MKLRLRCQRMYLTILFQTLMWRVDTENGPLTNEWFGSPKTAIEEFNRQKASLERINLALDPPCLTRSRMSTWPNA